MLYATTKILCQSYATFGCSSYIVVVFVVGCSRFLYINASETNLLTFCGLRSSANKDRNVS